MKKIIIAVLFALVANVNAIAQAVLPTSWSFATTALPTGWTQTGTAFYSASGSTPPACKFDNTGDMVTINFASNPGNLTYYLTGNSFSGGTFLIQESVGGITWTTLRTITAPPAGTYTLFTDVPATASRYIRFNYSNKVSGNIGLDDVNIDAGAAGPAQEINVKQASTTIVNGGTYSASSPVSTLLPTTFTIENLGTTNTLTIASVNITGPAAADFAVGSAPTTIAALSTGNLVINFTPSVAGTRNAIITINSDDADEAAYVINFNGIGGSFATEPTTQATGLIFSGVKSHHLSASFTPATPAPDGYIVLRRTGATVTDIPLDGTNYQRGDIIGNSQVVYSSTATAFYPNNIVANTTYYFAVYTFNGPGIYRNYLTTSPLAGNVTSSGSMQPATYYNTALTSSPTFVTDLNTIVGPHSTEFYSSYGPLMIANLYARDTIGDQRVVTCVYSGLNEVYAEPFDFASNDFARDHTFPQSWMPTVNSASFSSMPEYSDYHMLTPVNQTFANAVRSNYPLGEVVGTPISTYLGGKLGYDASGNTVYEVRDAHKGDAARCMLYQSICYTNVPYSGPPNTNCIYGGSWSLPSYISSFVPYGQDQNVLKRWHYQDPPDNFEIARNDYVDSLQGNRNPFIDSVQFVCYIDFSTMTKISGMPAPCSTASIADYNTNNDLVLLAPNPNNGNFTTYYTSSKEQKVSMKLFDVTGRIVYTDEIKVNTGSNSIEMKLQDLNKGIYLFEFTTQAGKQNVKLVID